MAPTARLELSAAEHAMLAGEDGPAAQFALRVISRLAIALGAERLIEITAVHVDGCLYHGRASQDFVDRLLQLEGKVRVPTTLNSSSLDLLHPSYVNLGLSERGDRRHLMDSYLALGCRPTWTCAPYQLAVRPSFGEQIAWAESNAIVFANSVLGARTNRYGDFVDICAAITGRVPYTGFHVAENRFADLLVDVSTLPSALLMDETMYPVLGFEVGRLAGSRVPAIVGLPATTTEDNLKAFGAAAASSGSVALFHAVGLTPEAETLERAVGERTVETVVLKIDALRQARDLLTTTETAEIGAVALGTPHFSLAEFAALDSLLGDRVVHQDVDVWVSTGRDIYSSLDSAGLLRSLLDRGVKVLVDTCTYITPVLGATRGPVLTNSAKWAYYAPGNLGLDVIFGSLVECVESAVLGRLWRDEAPWS